MNFSERLIKLRKENGLSQEELGEKLNVTRQTISKWELGQTTPEMSKLVEISNLFGVTLDELTDNKSIENESVENSHSEEGHNKRNKIIVFLLVGVLIALVILGVNKIFNSWTLKGIFNNIFNSQDKAMSQTQNLFEGIIDIGQQLENTFGQSSQNQNDFVNKVTQMGQDFMNNNGFAQNSFNSTFELYVGTEYGSSVKHLIDEIVTNNKKEKDKIITVIYNGISVSDPKEIQNLKTNFADWTQYEVSFEYDENGYIYQTDIMDLN